MASSQGREVDNIMCSRFTSVLWVALDSEDEAIVEKAEKLDGCEAWQRAAMSSCGDVPIELGEELEKLFRELEADCEKLDIMEAPNDWMKHDSKIKTLYEEWKEEWNQDNSGVVEPLKLMVAFAIAWEQGQTYPKAYKGEHIDG